MSSKETITSCLELDVERIGHEALVRCRGKLVAGVTGLLYSEVSQLLPTCKRIVLDLTNLTHMDSMGLGMLVRVYVSAKSSGCNVELINLGPRIRQLLSVTNVLSVFTVVGEHNIRML